MLLPSSRDSRNQKDVRGMATAATTCVWQAAFPQADSLWRHIGITSPSHLLWGQCELPKGGWVGLQPHAQRVSETERERTIWGMWFRTCWGSLPAVAGTSLRVLGEVRLVRAFRWTRVTLPDCSPALASSHPVSFDHFLSYKHTNNIFFFWRREPNILYQDPVEGAPGWHATSTSNLKLKKKIIYRRKKRRRWAKEHLQYAEAKNRQHPIETTWDHRTRTTSTTEPVWKPGLAFGRRTHG